MMLDLRAGVNAPELVASHVGKLVQFQLVRLVLLVEVVDIMCIGFEHVEPLVLLVDASRNRVVAPPPLV